MLLRGGHVWRRRYLVLVCVFFFQAEDGIRDLTVTGVQTCALPILPELKVDFRRRSGVVGVTGEEPPKAVPTPTERIHRGDAAVSPWLPSIVTMSEWARVCRTPPPITRLSAWAESEPTSTPTDAVHVQRGGTSYPASTWSAVALRASREDWAEAPERLRLASTARWACRGEIATPKSNPAAV